MPICTARLRERAEQCRLRARQASSVRIGFELEKLAGDYENDAARIEQFSPVFGSVFSQ
jgi:hypothetical protein